MGRIHARGVEHWIREPVTGFSDGTERDLIIRIKGILLMRSVICNFSVKMACLKEAVDRVNADIFQRNL